MFVILAAAFFALAALVHGAAITVHTHWLDATGLALLGLLCLALAAVTGASVPPWLRRNR